MSDVTKCYEKLQHLMHELKSKCKYISNSEQHSQTFRLKKYQRIINIDKPKSGKLMFTDEGIRYYYKILLILKKYLPLMLDSVCQKKIEILLYRMFQHTSSDDDIILKDWLKELFVMQYKEHTCISYIAGYPFKNSCTIDMVTIIPIKYQQIDQFRKKYNLTTDIDDAIIQNHPQINAIYCCKVNSYNGKSAEQIAQNYVNLLLAFIKAAYPKLETRLLKNDHPDIGIITHTDQADVWSVHNIFRHDFVSHKLDINVINEERKQAEKFFYKKDKTKFQNAILSALYWYGRIDITFDDPTMQYISYINSLERLAIPNSAPSKTKACSKTKARSKTEACSKTEAFSKTLSKKFKKYTKGEFKKIYQKRSKLLHGAEPDIYDNELNDLRYLSANLIFDAIKNNQKYTEIQEYIDS